MEDGKQPPNLARVLYECMLLLENSNSELVCFSLGYNTCDYMQTMSEFSQVWLDFINGKVPIENVLEEIGKAGYDCTQDVPWSLFWKELFEANGPDTKVILTVRDSTQKWWTSFLKFFTQEYMRYDLWGFNTM